MELINKINEKLKHGTLLQSLVGQLTRIGIQIIPYYWIEEYYREALRLKEKEYCDYTFEFFGPEDIRIISQMTDDPYRRWLGGDKILDRVKKGNKCFGAKYRGEIAAFMWINFDECHNRYLSYKLKQHEAYIFDRYVLKEFRGRGISPYMSNEAFRALQKEGITRFYSITEALNTPAMKSKEKTGSKVLKTCLYVRLFKKYSWRLTLRDES